MSDVDDLVEVARELTGRALRDALDRVLALPPASPPRCMCTVFSPGCEVCNAPTDRPPAQSPVDYGRSIAVDWKELLR